MSTFGKILVVVNLGLAAAFLGSAANYLGHQDTVAHKFEAAQKKWSDDKSLMQEEIDKKNRDLQATNTNLRKAISERDIAQTAASRSDAQSKNDQESYKVLAGNLSIAQRSVERMSATANADKKMIQSLRQDRDQMKSSLDEATERLDSALQELSKNKQAVASLERLARIAEQKLVTLEEENRQYRFQLGSVASKAPNLVKFSQPVQQGRVKSAAGDQVVISLGEEDGVKRGYRYTVARGRDYIATIQIDDTQAKQSSGFVVRGMSKGDVRQGDSVINAN